MASYAVNRLGSEDARAVSRARICGEERKLGPGGGLAPRVLADATVMLRNHPEGCSPWPPPARCVRCSRPCWKFAVRRSSLPLTSDGTSQQGHGSLHRALRASRLLSVSSPPERLRAEKNPRTRRADVDGAYSRVEVERWLRIFVERFYRQQFKRTCLPPGPKVGSVSLSPRGDLRLPDEVDPALAPGGARVMIRGHGLSPRPREIRRSPLATGARATGSSAAALRGALGRVSSLPDVRGRSSDPLSSAAHAARRPARRGRSQRRRPALEVRFESVR